MPTLIFSTGSELTSGSLVVTASLDQLDVTGVTGSFTGTHLGDGAGLINVSASDVAFDDVRDKPIGLMSGSVQTLANLEGSGIASQSADVSFGTISGSDGSFQKLTAFEFHTQQVSSSIIYQSGSTKFGDTADDVHAFTGSIQVDLGGFTGSLQGNATTADTGTYVAGSNVDGAVETSSYVAGANVDGAVTTADTASLVLGGNVIGAVTLADTASLVLGANVQGAVAVLDGEATGTFTGSFLGGVNLTSPSDMSGSTFAHQMPAISGKSAAFTISLNDNQNQQYAISASLEFLVEDGSVGQFNSIHFINSGAFAVTWPSNMKYHAGTPVTTSITSGALDIYTFTRLPDGTYAASIFGQDIA